MPFTPVCHPAAQQFINPARRRAASEYEVKCAALLNSLSRAIEYCLGGLKFQLGR
jgi:hypothetical protein